jgi:hypothetical protein
MRRESKTLGKRDEDKLDKYVQSIRENETRLAGVKRRLVVYLGDRPQRTEDGIDILPLREFLAALEQLRLW